MNKIFAGVAVVLVILLLIAGGAAYTFHNQVSDLSVQLADLKKNPQLLSQQETTALVEKVSQLIVLPQDETPTIATVSDPEALKSQPFFINSQKGDKVLIYTNARKAILYDPVSNKIVEVAPINIGQGAGTAPTGTASPSPSASPSR